STRSAEPAGASAAASTVERSPARPRSGNGQAGNRALGERGAEGGGAAPGPPRQRAPTRRAGEGSSRQQAQRETKRHVGLYVMVADAMPAAGFAPRRDFSPHWISVGARQIPRPHDDTQRRLRVAEPHLWRTTEVHFSWIHQMKDDDLMPALAQIAQRGECQLSIKQQIGEQ